MSWNEPKEMADYCHTIDEPDMAEEIIKLGERIAELEAQVDDLTSENNRLERAWLAINKRCHGYEIELGIRKPDAALQEDKP